MSILKKPISQHDLTMAEREEERAQLLDLRRQPNINKKLIDLALSNDAPRMTIDEINDSLGRNRWEQECEPS
jgi:hypothetical protein